MKIIIFGLSITSSWGNGHATTFRALVKALAQRGHDLAFFERDAPWYADHRDAPTNPHCRVILYKSLEEAKRLAASLVVNADLVILGSYVPEGVALGEWLIAQARGVCAFYDIDTPVTLKALKQDDSEYLTRWLVPRFDLYLSFTGGPTLNRLEETYGSPCARPLYCAVDPDVHAPTAVHERWLLGYLGTYSADRQATLERLLIEPAQIISDAAFAVAGAQYPSSVGWPANVEHIPHLAPRDHAGFYASQRFTLNVTRADMIAAGYSPSVRLFEAAACGVPIVSDRWPGIDAIFTPKEEILIADNTAQMLTILTEIPDDRRRAIAQAARRRVLQDHTAARRAAELEDFVSEAHAIRNARIGNHAYA